MKKCPYCGKKYSDEVALCELDHYRLVDDDDPAVVPAPPETEPETNRSQPAVKPSSDVVLGWFLIWAGIIGTLYFTFGFSTSLPGSDVVNLDRQQNRLFGFLESQVTFLAGLLMVLIRGRTTRSK